MKTKEIAEFKSSHPIGQSCKSGKWGWRRVNGCLDLTKCVWDTPRRAQLDRARAAIAKAEGK